MSKLKIKIVTLGHLPHSFSVSKVLSWKSDLFEIDPEIDSYSIVEKSDAANWVFSDKNIERQLPKRTNCDFLIAATNVPIQENFFARRFSDNRICLTYNEMTEILYSENIPLENLLYRVLYSALLVYKRYGNRIPLTSENTNFTHDDTRGCIFDMNGIKTDVVYSTNKPKLCPSCVEILVNNPKHRIEQNLIDNVQEELKKIKKGLYYRLLDFVKTHPKTAILISSITAILLGTIGSLIATFLWEKVIKHWLGINS